MAERGLAVGGKTRALKKATLYILRTALFLLLWIVLQNNSHAQVTSDFSASITQGCSPLVVCFTDLSTGNPGTWLWNFGNSNLSPDQNPCAIYINPGTYTVSLTVSNGSGSDTKTVNAMITVFANPVVDFSADNALGCAPKNITFTDHTTIGDAPIVSWRWDFGDGNTSVQQNPTNTYTNPGVYSVTLEVRDANGCEHSKRIDNMVTILASPDVDFTMSGSSCAFPATITFTNQTTGSQITDYFWNFGDGNTSTQENPVHTYSAPGSYDISLMVTNAAGCSATKTISDFSGSGSLFADFSVDDTSGCGSVSANFDDESSSSGTITSWHWDFGDGGTSTVQNTAHNYTVPGTYDVTLTITDNNGCTDTRVYNDLITVYPRPASDFTADQTSGCSLPFTVHFTETATEDVAWLWEFGDGTTSTEQNPTHTYTSAGSYGLRLTVTSADGCTRSKFKADYINITSPEANFWAVGTNGCLNLTVDFHDQSTSSSTITNWYWNFGDGGTSTLEDPSHTYTTEGEFDVRLVITNADGCVDTIVKTGYVEAGTPPQVNFGSDKQFACLGTPIYFYDSSDIGDEWLWDFGDGTTDTARNPVHYYDSPGAFNVTLIVFNHGCSDTLMRSGFVTISPPKADFEAVHSCTNPFEVTFVDNSLGPNLWRWNFGDSDTSNTQNNVHTYDTTGNYTVSLFVKDTSSGCVDSISRVIRITDPVADFSGSPLAGCYPLIVYFTSHSVDADSYQWFFGDGDTSSQENPIKVYDTSGVYDVMLVITDIHGCTDTIAKDDYVTVYGATAWFAGDTLYGCTPLHVDYFDSSSSFLGAITSWNWEFGNGHTSSLQNPSEVYTEPGIYSIDLRVSDSNGCVDSTTRVNYIVPTYPYPGFAADDTIVCVGQDVHFSNLSIGTGMTFLWNFGDGSISNDSMPVHAYSAEGVYTVSLQVIDINGCDSTIVKPLYIRVLQPHAALTADSTFASCPPLWVHFTDLTPANDSVVSWLWDFGDGQTSDLRHPTHVYTVSDTFIPSLTVTDFNGCKDTAVFVPITVTGPVGTFDFIQNEYCVPVPVQFFSDAADTIIHIYDYGDGNIGVFMGGDTIIHDYTYPGVFHPSLVLDNGHGCVISIDHPDSIITFTVIAEFSSNLTYLCHANLVHFYDSSYGVSDPVAWFWDFGDGDTSTLRNPSHYYSLPGTYDVMLVVTNAEGCTDTIIKPHYITVDPGPLADFTTDDDKVCVPETIRFTDASVSDSTIVSWQWDFGDSGTSSLQNPSHTFTTVDTFTVTLMIETNVGCRDTVSKPVSTQGPPVADAGPDRAICIGDTAALAGSGGVTYSWSPASTLSDPNISNPSAFPDSTTTYTLTVFDSIGCSDTDDVTVAVHPLPIVGSAAPAICIGDSAQLNASGGISYMWSPDSTLSNPNTANPMASPLTSTTYTVTVTDINGCVNTVSTTLVVHPLPTPTVSASNKFLCNGQSVQLNATGGVSYSWSPATYLNNPNIPNPVSSPPFTATYVVTVTDSNGCKAKDTIIINVYPLPNYTISPDVTICRGDSASLAADGGVTYTWYPPAGLSCTDCSNPIASPDSTTTYHVDITNGAGCTATDSIRVTVNPPPPITLSADTGICDSRSYPITASGGATYSWSPSASLSCANCPNPIASPDSTTTYVVTVTSAKGCSNTDSVTVAVRQLQAVAIFSDTTACVPLSVQFTDSSAADGIITSWNWDFGDGTSSTLQNPQHDYLTPGVYPVTLTVQSSYGCIDSVTKNITVSALPVANAGPDITICTGDTAFLNATGGVSYQWSPASSLSDGSIANPLGFPTNTTDYVVTVTDKNGCSDSDTVRVYVNPMPFVTVTSNAVTCSNTPVQLNATGGVTYRWTPASYLNNPNISNPTASPNFPITYTVLVTDSNGCQNTGTVHLDVYPVPVASISPDTVLCYGDSAQLWADGGVDYIWFPDSSLSCANCSNPIAKPTETTTYQVNIINSYGCMVTKFISVTVRPLQNITITKDTFLCSGSSMQLNVTGGVNYAWSPAAGLNNAFISYPVASPDTTTTYTVQVISPYGCVKTASVTVEVLRHNARMQLSDSIGCLPVNVQFTDLSSTSEPVISWNWDFDNGKTSSEQNPYHVFGTAGTYDVQLTITTERGCVDSANATVIVFARPEVIAGPDTAICRGASVQLYGSGEGRYDWSPSVGLNAIDIPNPVATPNVTRSYELIVTDSNGCMNRDSVLIEVHDFPITTISAGASLCYGDSTRLTATGGYTYSWTPAAGLSNPNIANPIARPQTSTVYVVEVASKFGCAVKDSVLILVRPKPQIVVKAEGEICRGESTQFTVSGAKQYEWYPATGLDCFTCFNPVVTSDTSITYLLRMTDANNCIWYDTIPLIVNPLPEVHTTDDKTICKGETVTLTTTQIGATSVEWTPANGLSTTNILSPLASPQQTTEYLVVVYNQYGCKDIDTVLVTVRDHIQTSVTDNLRICSGNSVTLEAHIDFSGSSGATVRWMPEDAFDDPSQPVQTVSPAESTTYMMVATGSSCASDTQYVHVHVDESPDVEAGEDRVVMLGTEVTFTATSGYEITSWYWSPSAEVSCYDCPTMSIIANESRTYYINVTDANGCPAVDSVRVRVITTCAGNIWVPNAFTPNGDEANDLFMVRSTGHVDLITFRVFDRWGNLMFRTDSFSEGWDGKYHGKEVNPDVYVWWVRAACPDGQVIELKGNVTAIK